MISAYKLTTVLLTTLLLFGCNSFPKITISIEDNASEERSKLESITTKSSPIFEPEESKEIGQKERSERTDASQTITQSQLSSPCSSTKTMNESNKISLLKKSNGRQTLSCIGTYCSGLKQFEGEQGFDGLTDDAVFAGKEVVYQFKDGGCATFDTFTVIATAMKNFDDKEFELLVGNESPTGKFESIGKFVVDGQTTSQTFNFEPKAGRYFKVKKLTRESFGDSVYKLQLWGALE